MIVAGRFSFNSGAEVIASRFPDLLAEVESVIAGSDIEQFKIKQGVEYTRDDDFLYQPTELNQAISNEFLHHGWEPHRVWCDYSSDFYTDEYQPRHILASPSYREIDFIKNSLGVGIQFGKYAFMVYNVCAKMTIFRNMGVIEAGIEIVPVRQFALDMSTGVSYFEQFVWDLQQRGVADIDVPVLILGVDR